LGRAADFGSSTQAEDHLVFRRWTLSDALEPENLDGMDGVVAKPLERVNVRSRLSQVTRAAWKLEASSSTGDGTIVLVEVSAQEIHYRGEGIFLGWPRERLARAYQALLPKPAEADPVSPQLG
jgi:hypothetical protein